MSNLHVTEIKAFDPSKNYELSKQFYKDIGFKMASEGGVVAYFHFECASFLLQNFSAEGLSENFMMHSLVDDVDAWWNKINKSEVVSKYGTKLWTIELQPWKVQDFCLTDPSGVLWGIGQNVE